MVLVGILAAVIVGWVILKWCADGLFNGTEAAVLFVVYGGLIVGLFAVRDPAARLLVGGALIGSAVWALILVKHDSLKQFYRDRIRRCAEAIRADPGNSAARSQMAQAYYEIGNLDSAIAAMELVGDSGPEAVKNSCKLRQWRVERELRDSKTVTCLFCNSKNLWGEVHCRTCKHPLIYPSGRSGFDLGKASTEYLAAGLIWLAVSAISIITMKPAQAGIVIGCLALAALGWSLLSSSKRK